MRFRMENVDELIIGRGITRVAKFMSLGRTRSLKIDVPDSWMSSVHARIRRQGTTFVFHDAGSTNGSKVNDAETHERELCDGDVLELGQTFFLFRAGLLSNRREPDIVDAATIDKPRGLISLLPSLSQQFDRLTRVVSSDAPIVLRGASGTGKEVTAKTVHKLFGRSGDFIAVNCGGLPDKLLESEFFGYKKGAFSGANHDHKGLIPAADGGTLFLDEIGDLPLNSQAVLLRALQERKVRPVGATKPVAVDFRLLCATHRDMQQLVEEKRFRDDLYARLSGFQLTLPPLEQRIEDIGILIGTLLSDLCHGDVNVRFATDALYALLRYNWPRNVRELRACLQTALALVEQDKIELEYFPEAIQNVFDDDTDVMSPISQEQPLALLGLSDEQKKRREELIALLVEHAGNISAVSRAMGKARSQVQRWLKRYQLDSGQYKKNPL